jgi:hypothetical protein
VLSPRAALCVAVWAGAVAAVPAAGQEPGLRGTYDPSASGRLVAVGVLDARGPAVVVRAPGRPAARVEGARAPALDGARLAYVDDAGVRVVSWRDGVELARVDGPLAKPALDWPHRAYVRVGPAGQRLEIVNLLNGVRRVVTRAGRGVDLGRPAVRGGLLAWHRAAGRWSEIRVTSVARLGAGRVVATSVTGIQVNPSLAAARILWVEHAASTSYLRLRALGGGPVRTLAAVRGPGDILWTTALGQGRAYVTRWSPVIGRGRVVSRGWR